MSLFSFFTRKSSAPVARDRLQILLAHERGAGLSGQSDLVAKLQEEILAVIAKHIAVDRDKVQIKLDRGGQVSTLEIDIEVPDLVKAAKDSAEKSATAKAEPGPAREGAPPSKSETAAAKDTPAENGKPALHAG